MHIEYTLLNELQEGFTAGFHVPLNNLICEMTDELFVAM